MNGHELLEAVGGISEKYIDSAGTTAARNNKYSYMRWVAAAVILCVVAVGSTLILRDNIITTRQLTPQYDESYRKEDESAPGKSDEIKGRLAFFPAEESLENVASATLAEIPADKLSAPDGGFTEEDEAAPRHLFGYLPSQLPEGYELYRAGLYETAMKSGEKYHMIKAIYLKDGGSEQDVEGFAVYVMNFRPGVDVYYRPIEEIYTPESLPQPLPDGKLLYLAIDDVCVGISEADLPREELSALIDSMKP